jgi:hypothetical protein
MAQSALTVTPPSPSPPTNMASTGATPPNVPNFTKVNYAEMYGDLDANGNFTGTSVAPGDRKNPNPPPYFDDGTAGPWGTFATNTAALASGTGATSGGTENTYPGTGTYATNPQALGAVPASTSVAHEGAGTEVTVTNPGNISHTYVVGTMDTSKMYSTGLTLAAPTMAVPLPLSPNATHASSDSVAPTAAPTITGLLPVAPVSSAGNYTTLTVNGTNFRPGAVVNIAGVPYQTQYNSATQLKVFNAPMRATAGNTAITVRVGATTTAGTNWVFS